MACFQCGAVMEFTSKSFVKLKRAMATRSCFEIRAIRLEVGGVCEKCRTRQATANSELIHAHFARTNCVSKTRRGGQVRICI
jgi:hypothetical protein